MSAAPLPSLHPALERLRTLNAARGGQSRPVALAQKAALEQFLALGLPTTRDEPWKYTSLRRFESRTLALPEAATAVDATVEPRLLVGDWQRITFVNGRHAPAQSSALSAVAGLQLRTLASVMQEAPQEAVALLGTHDVTPSARFDLVNRAFVDDGIVIDVSAGTVLSQPLYLVFESSGSGQATLTTPRVIVRAGANAKLTLIEHHVSAERAEHCVAAVTHLSLADGAHVEHYRLRQEGAQVIHLGSVSAEVSRSARYLSHTLSLGGTLSRLDLAIRLAGSGASCELNGVFLADGTQHTDTHSCIEHAVPQTRSSQDYRGLADGKGRGVFNGKVVVHKDAQKTDARQSSRNLLLSNSAEIDTRPELEIYADDVKCSHGATTGQLDAAALFYLRSRGIAEDEARGLLALAFVETVLKDMSVESVRDHVSGIFRRNFLKTQVPTR
ncbi:MAG: Fe-S cluster assembly protein SufD [Steroidobacteraceae bacterium]